MFIASCDFFSLVVESSISVCVDIPLKVTLFSILPFPPRFLSSIDCFCGQLICVFVVGSISLVFEQPSWIFFLHLLFRE